MTSLRCIIKAHRHSPTYGPYLVDDAKRCIVCTLEGTDPRRYPRDEGLYVKANDLPKQKSKSRVGVVGRAIDTMETMLTGLEGEIEDTEAYLSGLTEKREELKEVLKALKGDV